MVNNRKMVQIKKALIVQQIRLNATKAQKKKIKQILERFTVVAVNNNNVPHDSEGWKATLSRTGTASITTNFDEFGVARFFARSQRLPRLLTRSVSAMRMGFCWLSEPFQRIAKCLLPDLNCRLPNAQPSAVSTVGGFIWNSQPRGIVYEN